MSGPGLWFLLFIVHTLEISLIIASLAFNGKVNMHTNRQLPKNTSENCYLFMTNDMTWHWHKSIKCYKFKYQVQKYQDHLFFRLAFKKNKITPCRTFISIENKVETDWRILSFDNHWTIDTAESWSTKTKYFSLFKMFYTILHILKVNHDSSIHVNSILGNPANENNWRKMRSWIFFANLYLSTSNLYL